jgi:PPOX class probable F420-dependent enzyme
MMAVEIKPELAAQIEKAYFTWFTTVRADGMPQPTPVWFIRENDHFLIYSMPNAQKVKNIQDNPKVALGFSDSPDASEYAVVMGEARLETHDTAAPIVPAYLAKYAEGITGIGMTPEQMAATFNTLIYVTATHVRGE